MLEIGKKFGSFQIVEVLGRGSFKTVYRAKNQAAAENGYPKEVALGVPHLQDEESRKLLENEFRIVNTLQHPNIARIFGIEEVDGQFWAVMELVEGETLSSRLKRLGPLAFEQAIEVTRQIAEALDFAHSALVFHRDIKPANIKVIEVSIESQSQKDRLRIMDRGVDKAQDNLQDKAKDKAKDKDKDKDKDKAKDKLQGKQQDNAKDKLQNQAQDNLQVKVLDFGLARLMTHSQYLANSRVGSVAYMAPEQFGGAAGLNADIWALGVTFFQLITNALPFLGQDEASLVRQILYEPPFFDPLEGSGFEPRLLGVMRRALEKDPDKRYRRAGDLASDLEAVARHAGAVSPLEGQIEILLRAHFPLLFIHTHEEEQCHSGF